MGSEADRARIRQLLDDLSDSEEDGQFDDSDPEEDDNVEEFTFNTDTEEEGEPSDNEGHEIPALAGPSPLQSQSRQPSRVPCYVGKDNTTKWKIHCPPKKSVRTRQSNIVLRLPGVKPYGKDAKTPLDCWNLFIDQQILDIIVENTNLYILKCRPNYSRERSANCTDKVEVKALIGLLYLAGCLKSNHLSVHDLWDRNGCGVERFWVTMSEQRFLFLLRHIRFDNTDTRQERRQYDKFTPVRSIFEIFTQNCGKSYTISEFATVDEMLLGFRGRCSFRQYMPQKPNKYGLKVYATVCSKTRYLLIWEPYLGVQPQGPFWKDNSQMSLVQRLVQPISGTGRNLTFDNFFTSFPLIKTLLVSHRLTVVGTVRKNKRELPLEFVSTKERPVGSSLFGYSDDVTIVSYVPKKNKNVILASSMHHDDAIDESTGEFNKPEIITFYNATKGGVDTLDQLCENYNVARHTRRWPMVIFYGMLNVAGVNSQIIFLANNINDNICRKSYLRDLALALTNEHVVRRSLLANLPTEVRQRRQAVAGTSSQTITADSVPQGTRKRCFMCTKDSKTKYYCQQCKKFICLSHCQFICKQCRI